MTGAVRSIANTGTPGEIETSVAEVTEARYQLLRSRLLTPDELDKLPPPEPLIEHYCSLNSLMTTFGRPGTAKTLMAMTMSFAVVTGTPWFGHPVGQGPVLYIAGEGTSGLAQRQRAWREACGWPDLGGMHWLPMAVNLLDATWTSALVRLVEDLQPKLVTIDTLARSMPGGDENASADMSALVAASDRVREASRATVNLVHHTPKEGSTPRGHSARGGRRHRPAPGAQRLADHPDGAETEGSAHPRADGLRAPPGRSERRPNTAKRPWQCCRRHRRRADRARPRLAVLWQRWALAHGAPADERTTRAILLPRDEVPA